jgi:hypothetical protein
MAAMKPRTGDGPLEVTKEGRGIVMRVPLEGGGRLVVEMSAEEASDLGEGRRPTAASGPTCSRVAGTCRPRPCTPARQLMDARTGDTAWSRQDVVWPGAPDLA